MASRYSVSAAQVADTSDTELLLGYYSINPGRGVRNRVFRLTERWDLLAHDTQRDSTMWWVIADMNPYTEFDPFNRSGGPVYIPGPTEGV